MTVALRPLDLDVRTWWRDERTGDVREIEDPNGPPTAGQLKALWRAGALAVVKPTAPLDPFTKAEASYAIALLGAAKEPNERGRVA